MHRLIQWIFFYTTAASFPETGLHVQLNSNQPLKEKTWTKLQGWKLANKNINNYVNTGMFLWDVGIDKQGQSFHIKRGGVYYISLNTFLSSPTSELVSAQLTTTFNVNKTYTTQMQSSSKSQHLHLNRVLLLDEGETFYLSVFCAKGNGQVSSSTSITVHFLSPYEYTFGFIASLGESKTIKGPYEQLLVNWKPYFERMHGFFATSGDFVAVKSGYYLITFQMTLRNVEGEVRIILYNGQKRIVVKKEYFKRMSHVETLTYTCVYKVIKKEKIRFAIQTPGAEVFVDPSSSYSVVLIESITNDAENNIKIDGTVNYQFAALKKDNIIAPGGQEIQLVHWKNFHNHTAYLVNSAFQIRRSSFYFVHVEVHLKNTILATTNNDDDAKIRIELRLETLDRYRLFRQNQESQTAYFFGIFYIKNKQSISINIINDTPSEVTIGKDSTTIFIYELKLQTYSSLFEILPAVPTPITGLRYPEHVMRLIQKHTSNFNIITNTKDGIVIEILEKGIYYAALDVLLLKYRQKDERNTVTFTVMTRKINQQTWGPISRCVSDYRKQCFIPLILSLDVGQILLISRSDATGNISLHESHFHLNYICPSEEDTKTFTTNVRDVNKPIFKLPAKGYYLITGSLILENVTGSEVKVEIKYKRRSRVKPILSLKMEVWQSHINVAISEGFDAQEADTIKLSIQITDNDGKTSSFTLGQGMFSYLLITNEKDRFKSLKASSSTISVKGTVDFVARKASYHEEEKYISDKLFLRSVQSITSLVTVNLIGRIMPKRGKCTGQVNERIHARIQNEAHFQTSARKLNCGETVDLHLTGVLTTHPTEFIKVDVETDEDFVFKISKHSSISMFVLKDTMPFAFTSKDFLPEDLTNSKPDDTDESK